MNTLRLSIIAVLLITIISGAYYFLHRNSNEKYVSKDFARDTGVKVSLFSGMKPWAYLYYEEHKAYATGSLSFGSGICADDGQGSFGADLNRLKNSTSVQGSGYASSTAYAVSAPTIRWPGIEYCFDSTGFYGTTSSPTAASKGHCL